MSVSASEGGARQLLNAVGSSNWVAACIIVHRRKRGSARGERGERISRQRDKLTSEQAAIGMAGGLWKVCSGRGLSVTFGPVTAACQ